MSLMRSDDLQLCIKSGTQKKQQGHNFTLSVDLVLPLSKGIVGVFGKSGAGKSTLLRALAGLKKSGLDQAELKIHWQDKRIDKHPVDKNPCLLQTQQAQLFPNLTVLANLTFVIKHSTWASSGPFTLEQVIDWCGIEHLLTQPSTSLSGGEQQRVNLARSLLCGKPIILLDEPFSALDWNARVELLDLLVQLQQDYGLHFVIVSHSLKELALCSQHMLVIDNGEMLHSGSTTELIDKLTHDSSGSRSKTEEADLNNQTRFSTLTLTNPVPLAEYHLTKWQLGEDEKSPVIYTKGLQNNSSSKSLSSHLPINSPIKEKLVTLDANRVSLSRQDNLDTSMLNHLEASIDDITHIQHLVLVTLNVQGQTLYAEISLLSFSNLKLQLGETIFAQFKAL